MKFSLFQHPGGDRPLPALALLLTAVFALALQDSLVKLMSADTSFWQFQTLRSIGNLSFIVLLALASGSLGLMVPKNWRPVYLRAAFLMVCMFFFFAGAPFLSVPQMAAGLYTYPLFVSLLAGPVLAHALTDNPHEVPAIWCLFSISILLIGLGRGSVAHRRAASGGDRRRFCAQPLAG